MKQLFFLFVLVVGAVQARAQLCKVKIYYDANGNRIQRIVECTGRPAGTENPLSATTTPLVAEGNYQVYPNPTQSLVNIRIGGDLLARGCGLAITDMSGKVVFEQQTTTKALTTFDLGALANGVYFVVITAGDERHSVKVIKRGVQ